MLCDDLEGWDGGGVGGMLKREEMYGYIWLIWASLVPQLVKNLSAMQETWVQCLGWEDTLEKGMTIPSSILAWRIPWTVARWAPLSVGFSRQEYWSGLPIPSPKDFPNPGIEPRSPALQAYSLPSEPPGKPLFDVRKIKSWSINLSVPTFVIK